MFVVVCAKITQKKMAVENQRVLLGNRAMISLRIRMLHENFHRLENRCRGSHHHQNHHHQNKVYDKCLHHQGTAIIIIVVAMFGVGVQN
jgi:hypothetical protein